MVAAELVSELLPEKVLGPRGAAVARLTIRLDFRTNAASRFFLGGSEETLLPHALENDVAAVESAFVIGPRGQRRRRLDQTRHERSFGQRERFCRLPEQVLRHRLDAVDASAQIHAVQVELEDLALGQLLFE